MHHFQQNMNSRICCLIFYLKVYKLYIVYMKPIPLLFLVFLGAQCQAAVLGISCPIIHRALEQLRLERVLWR